MEHFYNNKEFGENWFSYSQFYADMIKRLPDEATIIEVGCWKGRSTACLGVEIVNSEKGVSLICVDSWKYVPSTEQPVSSQTEFDKVYEEFLKNTQVFKGFLSVIRQGSDSAADVFDNESIDFVFIDANHTYESVKADILAWLPKVKVGGIIAGHDYFTRVHPGVKEAVDELLPDAIKHPEQNVWEFAKK